MTQNWTDWTNYRCSASYREPAVYQFRLARKNKPVPIDRFLGRDTEGILSVGETSDMESRRKAYYKSIVGGYGHPSGKLLGLVAEFTVLRIKLGDPEFEYRYLKEKTKKNVKEIQDQMILQYILRFGEPPPLNSAISDRWNDAGRWTKLSAILDRDNIS